LKLGLYGGTFDPIHNGHIHVITQLLTLGIVDQVLVIPAGEPRLRENAPIATGAQRRTMCQLAVNDLAPEFRSKVEVNPIEILRMGPSYTIDTVEAVKQAYPDDEIILIVGTDAHQKIDQWHRVDELLKMVTLEIIERPGALSGQGRDIDAIDLSATQVRLGQSDQLPPSVANYIKEHNLYVSKP
jgi:nicotinate-nucleotide adenylyltransferase